jgi:dsDNA-specific endonuclease/ATPase MutS2
MVLNYPPCSSDLAPCNFFLFPAINNNPMGLYFEVVEEIQKVMITVKNFQEKTSEVLRLLETTLEFLYSYFEARHCTPE